MAYLGGRPARAIPRHRRLATAAALALVLVLHGRAGARVLFVGPDEAIKTPAAAAAAAHSGDTVEIEPNANGYHSCAIWRQDDLTIEGEGTGATITDTTCAGKALFVIVGRNVLVRNLTFARARVADGNGAGIRAEGTNLQIDHCQFVENEVGVRAADAPASAIAISDSTFTGNGRCDAGCTDGLMIDHVAVLGIVHSTFGGGEGRDQIRSLAAETQIVHSTIGDGANGPRDYLVALPDGGSLVMQQDTIERRALPHADAALVIVAAGFGAEPVRELVLRDNVIKNDTGAPLDFFLNWTGRTPQAAGNTLDKNTRLLSSSGHDVFLLQSLIHTSLQASEDAAHRLLASGPYVTWVKSLVRTVMGEVRDVARRVL